jgi:hypothetical protein
VRHAGHRIATDARPAEFGHGGLAQNDRPRLAQPRDDHVVTSGNGALDRVRTGRRFVARDVEGILDRDGDTFELTRVSIAQAPLRFFGGSQGVVAHQRRECVDGRIERLDPLQDARDGFHRRERPAIILLPQFQGGRVPHFGVQIVHVISRPMAVVLCRSEHCRRAPTGFKDQAFFTP